MLPQGTWQWHRMLQVKDTFWGHDLAAFVLELHHCFPWGLCVASAGGRGWGCMCAGGGDEWQEG